MDSLIPRRPGDYEIPWKFDTKENMKGWITTVDADNNEGYSRAQFELGKNNTGIFHGYLDTRVPKDGKTHYAGFANISGPELLVSTKLQDGVFIFLSVRVSTELQHRVQKDCSSKTKFFLPKDYLFMHEQSFQD